jgi:uncharacterized protein YaiE (UPF0345 family)
LPAITVEQVFEKYGVERSSVQASGIGMINRVQYRFSTVSRENAALNTGALLCRTPKYALQAMASD